MLGMHLIVSQHYTMWFRTSYEKHFNKLDVKNFVKKKNSNLKHFFLFTISNE